MFFILLKNCGLSYKSLFDYILYRQELSYAINFCELDVVSEAETSKFASRNRIYEYKSALLAERFDPSIFKVILPVYITHF
jgi:hypothetical protein